MRITVQVYGELKKSTPGGRPFFELRLEPGATLEDVLTRLSIKQGTHVSLINGKRAMEKTGLRDGDALVLFPPVCGG